MNLHETILSHFSCYFPHFILGGAPWRLDANGGHYNRKTGNIITTGNRQPSQQRKKKRTDQLNGQDP